MGKGFGTPGERSSRTSPSAGCAPKCSNAFMAVAERASAWLVRILSESYDGHRVLI